MTILLYICGSLAAVVGIYEFFWIGKSDLAIIIIILSFIISINSFILGIKIEKNKKDV